MKLSKKPLQVIPSGFTLMETVIAIGVLAVLLTGFVAVFAPATKGIRKSISVQQADRLVSALEAELVTYREEQSPNNDIKDGFSKAFEWIKGSHQADNALFVYQYRGNPDDLRKDGTPAPAPAASGQPGSDYIVQSIARLSNEDEFQEDLAAVEGPIFYVKLTQLIPDSISGWVKGDEGEIANTGDAQSGPATSAEEYDSAVIAFTADFFTIPTKSEGFLTGGGFADLFNKDIKPVFSRNLAIRR